MWKRFLILLISFLGAKAASAGELSFPRVWKQVEANSPAQDSARLMAESTVEEQNKADRHWLPKLYLDARSYSSNDPSAAFMGLLEQRSLQQSDFVPDSINHPSARIYSRAALGVDLPLYQGGAGLALVGAKGAEVNAKAEESEQVRLDQYSEVGRAYASVATLDRGLALLRELQAELKRLHQGYQLGSKANPVGYSGALGMKALANRLEALIQQYLAQRNSFFGELHELGVAESGWTPEPSSALEFSDKYFLTKPTETGSHRLEALRNMAVAGEKSIAVEKSKMLPQLGLFAEGYGFNGVRDTATGYSAGLYLRWNLFNPADYGSVAVAKLKAASVDRWAEAQGQEERASVQALRANAQALRTNIGILSETEQVLGEQARVTETLFRNGSINALQFVEVVSRRVDLTTERLEAELRYLQASAQSFTKEKSDISTLIGK